MKKRLKKCPACGFEGFDDATDKFLCHAWAYLYGLSTFLPTREQFEAMQREGFLPKQDGRDGRTWKLNYGYYGWAADHNWSAIAGRIMTGKTIKT